jgi:polysaccharide export outer membrane protein
MSLHNLNNPINNLAVMRNLLILILPLMGMTSCLPYRHIVNFQDANQAEGMIQDSMTNAARIHLQHDDVFQVLVYSYANPQEAAKFNPIQPGASQQAIAGLASGVAEPIGYRVDPEGNIELPVAGKVNVLGMTLEDVQIAISEKITATGYLQDNFVHVRFLSFKITLLGEINNPGTYTIPSQRITLPEAIAVAGDMTLFANRDKILIIREQDNKSLYGRVNLMTMQSLKSPYYNLHPGDIVYVEPHRAKLRGMQNPISPFIAPIVSVLTLVALIIKL